MGLQTLNHTQIHDIAIMKPPQGSVLPGHWMVMLDMIPSCYIRITLINHGHGPMNESKYSTNNEWAYRLGTIHNPWSYSPEAPVRLHIARPWMVMVEMIPTLNINFRLINQGHRNEYETQR